MVAARCLGWLLLVLVNEMILWTVCQQFLFVGILNFLMESLILAQDERWRRA